MIRFDALEVAVSHTLIGFELLTGGGRGRQTDLIKKRYLGTFLKSESRIGQARLAIRQEILHISAKLLFLGLRDSPLGVWLESCNLEKVQR